MHEGMPAMDDDDDDDDGDAVEMPEAPLDGDDRWRRGTRVE